MAGFQVAAAIDVDPILTSSFSLNFPDVPLHLRDIARTHFDTIKRFLPAPRPAGVIGGPPCQAFSEIGRRSEDDERRNLIWHFFRMVHGLRPKFFIMENVRGLNFSENRKLLDRGLNHVCNAYHIIELMIDAADFGAPTSRRRLFVVGIDSSDWDMPQLSELDQFRGATTVDQAIRDLMGTQFSHNDPEGFDWWSYEAQPVSEYARWLRQEPGSCPGTWCS